VGIASARARAALAVLAVAWLAGCAHARPPAAAPAPSPPAPVGTRAQAPPSASGSTAGAPSRSGRRDPSEEITPEELASIPDPVPGQAEGDGRALAASPPGGSSSPAISAQSPPTAGEDDVSGSVPPPSGSSPSGPGSGSGAAPGADTAPAWVWRVQIFATPDLAQADRSAKEGSARLGVEAHIEWETALYKVRLGDYPTEDGAAELRERAVRSGYPGAFRIRCSAGTTTSKE
jgi:sporulation related protein